MTKTITFNELRRLKDSLPDGSTHRIADELGISVETVRNYFGGHNFKDGKSCGIHIEPGPDGGLVYWTIPQYSNVLCRYSLKTKKYRKHSKRKEIHFTKKSHS